MQAVSAKTQSAELNVLGLSTEGQGQHTSFGMKYRVFWECWLWHRGLENI